MQKRKSLCIGSMSYYLMTTNEIVQTNRLCSTINGFNHFSLYLNFRDQLREGFISPTTASVAQPDGAQGQRQTSLAVAHPPKP